MSIYKTAFDTTGVVDPIVKGILDSILQCKQCGALVVKKKDHSTVCGDRADAVGGFSKLDVTDV